MVSEPEPEGMGAREYLHRELAALIGELLDYLLRPAPTADMEGAEAEIDAALAGIRAELLALEKTLWPSREPRGEEPGAAGEGELCCGLYREGSSKSFDQPGDEVYCLDCFEEIEYFDGPIKIIDTAEFRPLKASELGADEIVCTRCSAKITREAARELEGFSGERDD